MPNLIVRHEQRQYQRTKTDTIYVHIRSDLPAVGIINQQIDFGEEDDSTIRHGPIDFCLAAPAIAITGSDSSPRLFTTRDLQSYADAIQHIAYIYDEWVTHGHVPSILVQEVRS